ncbi:MAG: DUF397 domain-containing protein [Actinomycetota bacterium]|nr:DUF397 domain-containing protein [Actinomycetota bacterium]
MPTAHWGKSSFSNTGNGCVEIARTLTAVRDSKNPDGPRLAVDTYQLVAAVRSGKL